MPSAPAMAPYKQPQQQQQPPRKDERERERGEEKGKENGGKEGDPPLPRQNVKVRPPTPPKVISDKSGRMQFNRVGFLGEVSAQISTRRWMAYGRCVGRFCTGI